MSVIALIRYSEDKELAKKAERDPSIRRVPEAELHAFEWMGGWPGALIAQGWFHHKNKKLSYQIYFWVIVLIHVVGIIPFCADSGVRERAANSFSSLAKEQSKRIMGTRIPEPAPPIQPGVATDRNPSHSGSSGGGETDRYKDIVIAPSTPKLEETELAAHCNAKGEPEQGQCLKAAKILFDGTRRAVMAHWVRPGTTRRDDFGLQNEAGNFFIEMAELIAEKKLKALEVLSPEGGRWEKVFGSVDYEGLDEDITLVTTFFPSAFIDPVERAGLSVKPSGEEYNDPFMPQETQRPATMAAWHEMLERRCSVNDAWKSKFGSWCARLSTKKN